jgi:hypothetical protein
MIAARLLVETGGVEPEVAIERVRAVRPGAIETGAQERWVRTGPRPSRAADGLEPRCSCPSQRPKRPSVTVAWDDAAAMMAMKIVVVAELMVLALFTAD